MRDPLGGSGLDPSSASIRPRSPMSSAARGTWTAPPPIVDPLSDDRALRRRLLARLVRIAGDLRTTIAADRFDLAAPDLMRARGAVDALLVRSIRSGRERGVSWERLGDSVGVPADVLARWYEERADGDRRMASGPVGRLG